MQNWLSRDLQKHLLTFLSNNPIKSFWSQNLTLTLFNELQSESDNYVLKEDFEYLIDSLNLQTEMKTSPNIISDNRSDGGPINSIWEIHVPFTPPNPLGYKEEIKTNLGQWHSIIENNLYYLAGHSLIQVKAATQYSPRQYQITSDGIDFLIQDGGLKAILGVVTVKIHADTLKAIISAKIEAENDISPEEKSALRRALDTVSDTALSTITEKTIEAMPALTLFATIKTAFNL